MKNLILRPLVFVILFSLISSILVSVTGHLLGWKSSIQYSDGFFWAGLILISFGFISFQGYRQRISDWPPVGLSPDERTHLLDADILRGRNIMVFLGVCGLLMLSVSFLILKFF